MTTTDTLDVARDRRAGGAARGGGLRDRAHHGALAARGREPGARSAASSTAAACACRSSPTSTSRRTRRSSRRSTSRRSAINPGNYADKKRFEVREYTDAEYREELERVAERFRPLVRRCKRARPRAAHRHQPRLALRPHHEPLRRHAAGHGRERARVPRRLRGARATATSSSHEVEQRPGGDPGLPAARGAPRRARGRRSRRYPFHLGVTEAGDGEDGRVKSAIGIGALLEDGIGDTIRVSLTEDPVQEMPVARGARRPLRGGGRGTRAGPAGTPRAPRVARRRRSPTPDPLAPHRRAAEHARARRSGAVRPSAASIAGARRARPRRGARRSSRRPAAARELAAAPRRRAGDVACEALLVDARGAPDGARADALAEALARPASRRPSPLRATSPDGPPARRRCRAPRGARRGRGAARADALAAFARAARAAWRGARVELRAAGGGLVAAAARRRPRRGSDAAGVARAAALAPRPRCPCTAPRAARRLRSPSAAAATCRSCCATGATPFQPRRRRRCSHAATDLGAPLCDGIGDLVSLGGFGAPSRALGLAYRILQGARLRTSWTEFISCPSLRPHALRPRGDDGAHQGAHRRTCAASRSP